MMFSEEVVMWYQSNQRDLPWRNTTDAYLIWLSEVILQQTRVAQGLSYYHLFSETFPTVGDLAHAEEDTILRMWQGLGYYSRARNLHKAAKRVMSEFGGVFPSNYNALLTLPGIGEYTAAAVSSFSANEKHAVLDGNVFRVLSRYWGLSEPINTPKGKKEFTSLANELIVGQQPSVYNQAIMEFGALQCKPKSPNCEICPLLAGCYALANNMVAILPNKLKKGRSRNRYFNYFIIQNSDKVLINKRGAGDIWQHLHDFPMIESTEPLSANDLAVHPDVIKTFGVDLTFSYRSKEYKHVLSHQNIYARFILLEGSVINLDEKRTWNYVLIKDLDKLAKSKLIVSFLDEYYLQ